MSQTTLLLAAKEYLDRQRGRRTPNGHWLNNVYYLPDKRKEYLPCCDIHTNQIENNPLALYEHQKSLEHVSALYSVNAKELKSIVNYLKSMRKNK